MIITLYKREYLCNYLKFTNFIQISSKRSNLLF